MAEDLALHQLMASDAYWAPESEPPFIPAVADFRDGFSVIRTAAQRTAVEIQTLFRRSEAGRTFGLPIAEEEQLPLMIRGEGLLKVVQDSRRVEVKDPARDKGAANDTSHEQFDLLAQMMLEDPFYAGTTAQTSLYQEESDRHVRLWRTVSFMSGSRSGFQLEGILSSVLREPPSHSTKVEVIPPLVVGRNYALGRSGKFATKVVAAQVVRPGISKPEASGRLIRPRFPFSY